MLNGLERTVENVDLAIAENEAESNAFDMSIFSGGSVLFPAAWTDASAGFKVCGTLDGTYVPLRDGSGALVQITGIITNAAAAYPLPDELFGCRFVKLWSCTSEGVATNQAAARALIAVLKG